MTATAVRSLVKCYTARQFLLYKKYGEIVGNVETGYTPGILHNFGGLHRLAKNPHFYNASHFAISTSDNAPVCLISLTHNASEDKTITRPCELYGPNIQFPNYEIMGFTKATFRGQGHAANAIDSLLRDQQVAADANIYVYSHRMERILRKLGFNNSVNLHDHRPENFKPLGALENIFRFAFFHTARDTNYPILIVETHEQDRAIQDLKKYIVEWGINKIWDLDSVELGQVGIIDAFVVNTRRNEGIMCKATEDSLYLEHAYIFRLKEKSVVSYCDLPF